MIVGMFTSWSSSLKNIRGFGAGVRRWLWLIEETRKAFSFSCSAEFWFGYGSIPIDTFLVGWTSIYQLFWGSRGARVLTNSHLSNYSNHALLHVFRFPTCCPVLFGTPLSGDVRGEMSHSAGRWTKMMKRRSSSVCPRVLCHPWVHDILKVASRQKHPRTWGSDWDLDGYSAFISIILEFLHHTCPIMVMPQGLLIVCGRLG